MAASTPENAVKKEIDKLLKTYEPDLFVFRPIGNARQRPTLDYIGAYKGHSFAIEAKAPGKKPTPRQLHTMKHMSRAGIVCFVIDGAVGLLQLRTHIEGLRDGQR